MAPRTAPCNIPPTIERDTVWLTDTVLIPEPKEISSKLAGEVEAVLPIATDSTSTDSARVTVPIERKVYADSNYRAVVEDYRPSLVSLEIYQPKEVITVTKTQSRLIKPKIVVGPSLTIGYDPLRGQVSPVIGISVTVPLIVK
ncbi:MAG: hypothetical protein K2M01_00755 [Paramuribaculum sp.]|nr:hypothetical protein [Paramuribaculum sp.]